MKLFNSLTRQKEEFIPIDPKQVKMYACGPTVYNYFHIGNARPFIIFDTLRRYFEYKGLDVQFVQNFTDIDDKMINKANELGITVKQLGEQYIAEYFKDASGLAIKPATVHPKATEHIDAIIALIVKLEQKGYAYNVDGDVYFSTKQFEGYGKLSHQPLEDLEIGVRVDVNEQKRDAMDFSVWKKQKPNEPAWESPWGMGRPGWHIECSAMANAYLGDTIDIHCGGQDLIFPHHENEIAQSEAANGVPFAHYWVHNGYINVDNQKMSKSLGNFFTVRDVAAEFDYEVIRFFMLSAHYRSPINFSKDLMHQAQSGLDRIYTCIKNIDFLTEQAVARPLSLQEIALSQTIGKYKANFEAAMEDDLNTADAIAALFDMVREINVKLNNVQQIAVGILQLAKDTLTSLGAVLGILQKQQDNEVDAEVAELIEQRQAARANKNWPKADEIRDLLKAKGIELADTPQGVKVIKLY
ncbi:MAG: cysteine--tRNA ligase [Hyphomonadaceae bacterium]|nr:cysteine--tRNA ligase [Clostridia bacterium]